MDEKTGEHGQAKLVIARWLGASNRVDYIRFDTVEEVKEALACAARREEGRTRKAALAIKDK